MAKIKAKDIVKRIKKRDRFLRESGSIGATPQRKHRKAKKKRAR